MNVGTSTSVHERTSLQSLSLNAHVSSITIAYVHTTTIAFDGPDLVSAATMYHMISPLINQENKLSTAWQQMTMCMTTMLGPIDYVLSNDES